jgi:predicted AAA+ superfamily ATPase
LAERWQPGPEDLLRVISEQNPWLVGGGVPETLAPRVERPLVQPLCRRLLDNRPRRFHVVLGPRPVGKTTVMYQLVRALLEEGVEPRRLTWLRLDHPLLMGLPLGDLVRVFLEGTHATLDRPAFLFLDEIVYARDWDLWLKTFYDERWPVCIVASSSATAVLRERRTESGVGRWEEHFLTPYLLSEYVALRGAAATLPRRDSLWSVIDAVVSGGVHYPEIERRARELMLLGGFPELLVSAGREPFEGRAALLTAERTLRADAVERAIYKDIPQSFGIDNPLRLERVLYVLAGQLAQMLSPTAIAQDLGLSQPTLDRYLGYLERAFLIFLLPNFAGSEAKVQRRGRKAYFVDGAVRNAALQRGVAPLSNEAELGLLRENMVAAHLHALAAQTQTRVFHWRSGKHEVDLVYDYPEFPLAFEIASSSTHSRSGLAAFRQSHPRFERGCFLVAPDAPAILPERGAGGIGSMPLDLLLLVIGAHAEHAMRAKVGPVGD